MGVNGDVPVHMHGHIHPPGHVHVCLWDVHVFVLHVSLHVAPPVPVPLYVVSPHACAGAHPVIPGGFGMAKFGMAKFGTSKADQICRGTSRTEVIFLRVSVRALGMHSLKEMTAIIQRPTFPVYVCCCATIREFCAKLGTGI